MKKKCIMAPRGPAAAGPYSHAVAAGNLLFVSGQGPMAPDGSGLKTKTFEEEVRQTFENLKAILEDAGSGMQHVVKTNVYLDNMDNFGEMNAIYKEYFPSDYPARTTIQAARLPLNIRIEIEAVAILPSA